jgi:dTMP kinase
MKSGMFIVFEGIDGSGTTTQTKLLADWFQERSLMAHLTWEPSPGRIGRLIREYLAGVVDVPDVDRHYHSLALLFAADRLDHLAREVEPRLKEGTHVISDRYVLSSLVYQSLHCDPAWVRGVNCEAIRPHVTFLLDVPVEAALERLARRNLFTISEIYETEEQLTKIRGLYLKAAREMVSEHNIIVIDGGAEVDEVKRQIISQLEPRLNSFIAAVV